MRNQSKQVKDKKKIVREFNVEGPTGTSSLCNVTFPQSLISDVNNLKVKLDNNQIAFNYTLSDNMVKISFLYSNSEHVIKVSTKGDTSADAIPGYELWVILGTCFILIGLIIKRKDNYLLIQILVLK